MPPRDPAYPQPGPGHAQDRGAGPRAAGPGFGAPGYASPGGPRPGGPGHAGAPGYRGQADGDAPFDGGYAKVIRASDHPVRPAGPARPSSFGRPPEPARPAEAPGAADVYVYRDTSDQPGGPAATGPGPGENDTAYWYDLPGSEAGTGAPPQVAEETRGPFEPLVSSSDPPGAARRFFAGSDAAQADIPDAAPDAASPGQAPGQDEPGGTHEETAYDRARKLEQIKDLYLTAEAIGEANVDKHFDQLLAQQRELIGEYFRQPGPAGPAAGSQPAAGHPAGSHPAGGQPAAGHPAGSHPAGGQPAGAVGAADQAETDPGVRWDPGPPPGGPPGGPQTPPSGPQTPPSGPKTPPEGARVAADRPRAW